MEAHQILFRFISHSDYTRIIGIELAGAREGRINVVTRNMDFVCSFTHAFSPTAKLPKLNQADILWR